MWHSQEDTFEYNLKDVIGHLNIVIVGGKIEKLRILETKYPDNISTIMDPNFSDSLIRNADIVLCFYEYLSHSTFNKVQSLIDTSSDRFVYCKYSNLDLIESKLYRTIIELKLTNIE